MKTDSPFYEENDHLILKLRNYLNYEITSSLLLALSFVTDIALFLAILVAVIFTPFMLYVLVKTKKFGWVSAFTIFILIPSIILPFILRNTNYVSIPLLIELGVFYLYCFILRFMAIEWSEDINMRMYRKKQMKEKEEKDNLFQNYFDNR